MEVFANSKAKKHAMENASLMKEKEEVKARDVGQRDEGRGRGKGSGVEEQEWDRPCLLWKKTKELKQPKTNSIGNRRRLMRSLPVL